MIFGSLPNEDGDEPGGGMASYRLPRFGVCEPDIQ